MNILFDYYQFLNEEQKLLRNHTEEDLKDAIHFLGGTYAFWEDELIGLITKVLEYGKYLDFLLSSNGQIKFNIKIYNQPDIHKLSIKTNVEENLLWDEWEHFLTYRLNSFTQEVEENYKWITDSHTSGRSGGWINFHTKIIDVRDNLWSACQDYRWAKERYEEIKSTDDEEDELIKMYFNTKTTSDLFSAVPEIIKEMDTEKLKNTLNELIEGYGRTKNEIEKLKEEIKVSKQSIKKDFYRWILR